MRNSFSSSCNKGYAARPGGAQDWLLAESNEHEEQHRKDLPLAQSNCRQEAVPTRPGARDLQAYRLNRWEQLTSGGPVNSTLPFGGTRRTRTG
ncbi:hypothetical protein [Streptomyces sp. MH13]|uniref:hypothetical protein n=1 Tax=Streptomyces sp. MH13 TaxID=3417651 RepID=UPI003CEC8918